MSTRISALPIAVLDSLSVQIDELVGEPRPESKLSLLRLPHPRTGISSLFLPVETPRGQSSIIELQNVAPNARRSWFNDGEVLSDGSLLLMTPIDPVFLLVPLLRAVSPQDGLSGNFRTIDDLLEDASVKLTKTNSGGADASAELVPVDVLELTKLPCAQDAMRRICETKGESSYITSDLLVFRYSHPKLLEYLVKKVTRIAEGRLFEKSRTLERELAKDGLMDDGKEELLRSGQLKLACDLISQYLTPDIYQELLGKFNFLVLTSYVAVLKATDSMQETSTTNGAAHKVLADEKQDGKKRKAGAQGSIGVAKLKKANIKGMSKLSSFFQKKS